MSLPLVLRPEARIDLLAAQEWYEQQQSGLGPSFSEEIDRALERISAMPDLYEIALGDARHARVKRFPYVVYFRKLEDHIEILAVLHGRRDPQIWRDRI